MKSPDWLNFVVRNRSACSWAGPAAQLFVDNTGAAFNVTLDFNNGTSATDSGYFWSPNAGEADGPVVTRNRDATSVTMRYSAQQ